MFQGDDKAADNDAKQNAIDRMPGDMVLPLSLLWICTCIFIAMRKPDKKTAKPEAIPSFSEFFSETAVLPSCTIGQHTSEIGRTGSDLFRYNRS